jgi:hypothetical protein
LLAPDPAAVAALPVAGEPVDLDGGVDPLGAQRRGELDVAGASTSAAS